MINVALLTAYQSTSEVTPNSITVLIDGVPTQIELQEKLRALPGRRAVYKALSDNRPVLVKLFAGANAARDVEREKQGINALINSHHPTPALLSEAQLSETLEPILITEFLENVTSFKQCWHNASDDEHVDLLKSIMQILGNHHQSGLYQRDIHLDNFLVKNDIIYTIDGGAIDITHQGKPLTVSTRINNLALFFAQWDRSFEPFIEEALYFYHQATELYLPLSDVIDKVNECRKTKWKRYQKKIYRECSEFVCEQTHHQLLVCRRDYFTPAFAGWLSTINADLDNNKMPNIKNGATATVARFECDGHSLIVKRYNIKSIWHRISRMFRPTRAWHAWRNGYLLRFLGINTPLPVALIEKRNGWLRGTAFLVTEAVQGVSLKQAVIDGVDCVSEVSEQIKKIAAARISHGDMKATNFMVSDHEVYVIDLDAMKQHHSELGFKDALAKDRERFMRNWNQQPEIQKAFSAQLKNIVQGTAE